MLELVRFRETRVSRVDIRAARYDASKAKEKCKNSLINGSFFHCSLIRWNFVAISSQVLASRNPVPISIEFLNFRLSRIEKKRNRDRKTKYNIKCFDDYNILFDT